MAKKKDIDNITDNSNVTVNEKRLYKYEIGDEVFTMEFNKVKSFIIQKRIIVTRFDGDGNIVTLVYYDESNWDSTKAMYAEDVLYPSKEKLLESL